MKNTKKNTKFHQKNKKSQHNSQENKKSQTFKRLHYTDRRRRRRRKEREDFSEISLFLSLLFACCESCGEVFIEKKLGISEFQTRERERDNNNIIPIIINK